MSVRRSRGYTFIELLVSLALIGVLIMILGRAMGEIINNNDALSSTMESVSGSTTLRRILHRDLQGMQPSDQVELTETGFTLITGHNMLSNAPVPMNVEWDFSQNKVLRTETAVSNIDYTKEMDLVPSLEAWKLEAYVSGQNRWIDLTTWQLSKDAASEWAPYVTALRLTLAPENAQEMVMVERMPHKGWDEEEELQ
jgi:prepilin-type N-terminal cleavage/methylation domain-containing protein